MASLSSLPMVVSPLALTVPICAISFGSLVDLALFLSSSTITSTALSMPRLISIGLWPAATSLEPSRKMACASTVAVVVPSPATSAGLRGNFTHHLRAHVLELVLELDLFGNGHAVFGDGGESRSSSR